MSSRGRALIWVIALVAAVSAMALYFITRVNAEDEKPQSMSVIRHTPSMSGIVKQGCESKGCESSKRFCTEFLPEVTTQADHKWIKGLPKEERENMLKLYKERYGQ